MQTNLFINGEFVPAVRGNTFQTINPATAEVITEVASATAEDVDLAVAAAKACLYGPNWGYNSTGAQRAVILRRLGELISEKKEELCRLEVMDQGKPMREADADMNDAISACEHFATLAEEQDCKQNEVIENGTGGDFITTIVLEPLGVIAAITPWNYPLLMGIWKVIPAIAAGCCVVLKNSELAPLSCLVLAELCKEAGLPNGALNVLTGLGPSAGAPLSSHPDVDKISFTGSGPTGKVIMRAAAMGPRGISLELGGKSPLIVFPDADIDSAVDWILTGVCWGTGQVCSSTSRVYVHTSIREEIIAKVISGMASIKIGNQLSEECLSFDGPLMGPVVSEGQYTKIWKYIEDAKSEGLNLAYGGEKRMVAHLGNGFFIPPTLFVDVPTTSTVWREEIFGPVLCIRDFSSEEEVIMSANDSQYGLAAAVFSADLERCTRVTKAMRCGVVWTNCCQPAFIQAPWGGIKESGFGRDLGRWGLEEFTSVKQVTGCAPGYSWNLWKSKI